MTRVTLVVLGLAALAFSFLASAADLRPILIQGALQMETERLASRLDNAKIETTGTWTFWRGTFAGYPVVVSKTRMGASHAAAATALAIERYRPIAIINQGTAGGHDPALRVYDIVLGVTAVSLGAFKTPHKPKDQGSNPLEWAPIDLRPVEGEADDHLHKGSVARFAADGVLLEAARAARTDYQKGSVVEGVIGSSDVWNEEIDRIANFRARYGTSVEEMETAAAAQVAGALKVPFLGIRIVSANVTSGGAYDAATAEACQEYVLQVVRRYAAGLGK